MNDNLAKLQQAIVASDVQAVIPDAVLNDFGKDITVPSMELIEQGKHGNGSYQDIPQEVLAARQAERQALRHAKKMEAIEQHEDEMVETVATAAKLRRKLIENGNKLMERKINGESLSENEERAIKQAQKAADQVENRTIGKIGVGDSAQQVNADQVNILNLWAGPAK